MIPEIERYILDHIEPQDKLQVELERQTNLNFVQPRMLSGHIQGELLRVLTLIINPLRVLELGTFTGYSALSIAAGLPTNGQIHTIEIDDELEDFAFTFFNKSQYADRIFLHIGDAIEIAPSLGMVFDLVFIDADKREYMSYYNMLFDKKLVRSSSVILVDNVLWSGKVAQEVHLNDKHTQRILEFNRLVAEDDRVDKVIIPIRDGLTILRVK